MCILYVGNVEGAHMFFLSRILKIVNDSTLVKTCAEVCYKACLEVEESIQQALCHLSKSVQDYMLRGKGQVCGFFQNIYK